MLPRVIGFLLLTLSVASARTWPLIPFEQRWECLDIIAVVEVGPVHTVETPEGVALQSADARIEKLIYRKHEEQPLREDSGKIRLYFLSPNGMENAGLTLRSGKAFIMMKQQGFNAYSPTDPWEFQPLAEADRVAWPHQNEIKILTLEEVIGIIDSFMATHPAK